MIKAMDIDLTLKKIYFLIIYFSVFNRKYPNNRNNLRFEKINQKAHQMIHQRSIYENWLLLWPYQQGKVIKLHPIFIRTNAKFIKYERQPSQNFWTLKLTPKIVNQYKKKYFSIK